MTGEGIWNITGAMSPGAVADGYLVNLNPDDGYTYSFGKGQSATTVTASPKTSAQGGQVLIEGTVLDQSPAQPGTPCVSACFNDYTNGILTHATANRRNLGQRNPNRRSSDADKLLTLTETQLTSAQQQPTDTTAPSASHGHPKLKANTQSWLTLQVTTLMAAQSAATAIVVGAPHQTVAPATTTPINMDQINNTIMTVSISSGHSSHNCSSNRNSTNPKKEIKKQN